MLSSCGDPVEPVHRERHVLDEALRIQVGQDLAVAVADMDWWVASRPSRFAVACDQLDGRTVVHSGARAILGWPCLEETSPALQDTPDPGRLAVA